MNNFWDYEVWGFFILVSVLLLAIITANTLKRMIRLLRESLIPSSVLGGIILLLFSLIYKQISGNDFFAADFFNNRGSNTLEVITYHSLALGFISTAFKSSRVQFSKKRIDEIFNTGVTTVSTYLLQGILGLAISITAGLFVPGFFKASGLLLPFGFGQGTGQALNYGSIYENDFGFTGGKSFGLSVAALGFLSASIGGVIYLNVLRHRGLVKKSSADTAAILSEEIQGMNEIPMQESMDKITVQFAFVTTAYLITYLLMSLLCSLLPGIKSIIFGFNFLLGVIVATVIKIIINKLTDRNIIHRNYLNNFLMTRLSNFFFDLMVVAGIAAIKVHVLKSYWIILIIMSTIVLVATFVYNILVAGSLFPDYRREQFLMMYGMLTGTASTGIILLREVDYNFETPAADNMVYQNFPAIVFGFPLMFLATLAPVRPILTLIVLLIFFLIMNVLLFRQKIFRTRSGISQR